MSIRLKWMTRALTADVRSLVLRADGQSGRVSITHWMTVGEDWVLLIVATTVALECWRASVSGFQ